MANRVPTLHPNMNWEDKIRFLWPCPPGFREIRFGEKLDENAILYDRTDIIRAHLFSRWDTDFIYYKWGTIEIGTNYIWFLVHE